MHRSLATAIVVLAWSGSARADVPPPEAYVEECTVDKAQARTKQTCQSCSAWHGDAEACTKQFAGSTLTRDCKTAGASTWEEVWCGPKAPLAAEPVADPATPASAETPAAGNEAGGAPEAAPPTDGTSKTGCAIGSDRGERAGVLALGCVILVAACSRRRRR